MFLGERLRIIRIKKGLSQQLLGDMVGVSKVSICGYELGNRTPSIDVFLLLVEKLEVSPDYLLGRDVFAVNDFETSYNRVIAREDLNIIEEIKKDKKLYRLLYNDPKRTIELIIRKLNK